MFLELEDNRKVRELLLAERRKKKNKASSYMISVGESDEAESAVGTMRSNRLRTKLMLSDGGRNLTRSRGALLEDSCMQELVAVSYKMKNNQEAELIKLESKAPAWDEEQGAGRLGDAARLCG
ncbi:hypothetical protein AOLI_G00158770 [Acnodon oligacanthus]